MGLFNRKKVLNETTSLAETFKNSMGENLGIELCNQSPLPCIHRSYDESTHIPIWYVFKHGLRIDLNTSSLMSDLMIEEYPRNYDRFRKLGQAKIKAWEKLNQVLPMGKKLAVPEIVFYE